MILKNDKMAIYYFMFEAVPSANNPEKEHCEGSFIYCWVNGTDMDTALKEANNYVNNEGWEVINIEDQFLVERERYEEDAELGDLLECFDQAVKEGISVIIYTWPNDNKKNIHPFINNRM